MKIVVAIDSLKGSLTSLEAGAAAREGILSASPASEVKIFPLADGGEGTCRAIIAGLGGELKSAEVTDPLGGKVLAEFGEVAEKNWRSSKWPTRRGFRSFPKNFATRSTRQLTAWAN